VLVKTPYVLLRSHPGINVVSAAALAGEMGPIENYATAKLEEGAKHQESALKARRRRQKGPPELGTLLVGVLAATLSLLQRMMML